MQTCGPRSVSDFQPSPPRLLETPSCAIWGAQFGAYCAPASHKTAARSSLCAALAKRAGPKPNPKRPTNVNSPAKRLPHTHSAGQQSLACSGRAVCKHGPDVKEDSAVAHSSGSAGTTGGWFSFRGKRLLARDYLFSQGASWAPVRAGQLGSASGRASFRAWLRAGGLFAKAAGSARSCIIAEAPNANTAALEWPALSCGGAVSALVQYGARSGRCIAHTKVSNNLSLRRKEHLIRANFEIRTRPTNADRPWAHFQPPLALPKRRLRQKSRPVAV